MCVCVLIWDRYLGWSLEEFLGGLGGSAGDCCSSCCVHRYRSFLTAKFELRSVSGEGGCARNQENIRGAATSAAKPWPHTHHKPHTLATTLSMLAERASSSGDTDGTGAQSLFERVNS